MKRAQDRTPEERTDWVARMQTLYNEGASVRLIAKQEGISRQRVYQLITSRQRRNLEENVADMQARYDTGESVRDIAQAYHTTPSRIYQLIRANGRAGRRRQFTYKLVICLSDEQRMGIQSLVEQQQTTVTNFMRGLIDQEIQRGQRER